MSRIVIESDGTMFGTRVLDEQGQEIEGLVGIEWKHEIHKLPVATIIVHPRLRVSLSGRRVRMIVAPENKEE